ncbi:hypothetical protein Bb109J_c1566 [Bdellovibrio bacteriovorus]|uniref:hypothetical protein n=1 Tax=Bdellovibrio bacteriovorus TaxID=959 RepID=UPI00045BF63A|nr:hypothetical protein [Bdellovibrio bacteriovorus]AHZ84260.1 hypothetical protein EP01_04795 [Bdellovibrio bacteriovorus]BEV68146.1 hypothetical protein Bb109J_c1566 [Bdellovibrio bacteriovorus]
MNFAKYFVFGLFLTSQAHAYLSIAESGELLAPGKYQVGVEPQLLTNKGNGANFNVFFDTALSDSSSARISMGAGAVDFNTFASVKWIPIPDVDNQPAMGLRAGAGIARDEDENLIQFQFSPLVSKRFDTEYGLTVPYLAVPFTFLNTKDENFVASNLALGSEFHYVDWKEVNMGAEVGIDLNKSYSYISLYLTFPFESHKGFGK